MRFKFLRWLRNKVFKVPEGAVAPKLLAFFYHLFFPLHWFYENQSNIKYDTRTNIYTVNGLEMSGEFIDLIKGGNGIFRISEGRITIENETD